VLTELLAPVVILQVAPVELVPGVVGVLTVAVVEDIITVVTAQYA
jgi:hypothetical protein